MLWDQPLSNSVDVQVGSVPPTLHFEAGPRRDGFGDPGGGLVGQAVDSVSSSGGSALSVHVEDRGLGLESDLLDRVLMGDDLSVEGLRRTPNPAERRRLNERYVERYISE